MTVVAEDRRGGLRIVGSGGGGKGGGGSARTPVEHPDSLHNTSYAAVLDVIGNGEMAGPAHGSDALRDIYLNGTPIQNADGTLNFRNVQVEYRVGTQDQEHIPGFPASANVTSVGTEVTTLQPWVQAFSNSDLSAVRVSIHAPRLIKAIESGGNLGDRVGYKVEYAIDRSVGGGSYVEVVRTSLDGKTINGYTRTHRIELPAGASSWAVRVRRITPDSTSSSVEDDIYVQSYAEVIDGKFRYPMTALVGIKIDAEQFQSIPTRAYHWRGQIIRVPSNYDPQTRTYSGVWDGTFKRAWSNNPAWVYFDILTNKLYGLGERIDASMIDRYALYQIGAYCDQMVPDGLGGTEPRFACNVYLQSAADALRVLNDLTSVFRGMAYWANGQVVAVADMPSDPVYTYTNGNVIDGRFEYTGADLSTLKTVALVSWNDPSDFGRSKVEVVEDEDGIRRYGIRKTEVVAFGCSSRGQAQRVGLYHLYTSRMETGGVAFSVGLDGVIPQPGSIVKVADRNRAGRHIGGRIRQATSSTVTLDRDHPIKAGDSLTVNLPDGTAQSRPVSLVLDRVVTVNPAFSQAPAVEAVWAVDADDLVTQHVRVMSVKENDGITFTMSGVFHHPGKYAAIDSGVRLDPLPVSVVPPRVQRAPTNVQISQHHTFHQGTTRHYAEISWDAPEHAVMYDAQWRRDNGDWVQAPRTGTRLIEIPDIYAGLYVVRVRAINSLDVPSLWAYSDATELDGLIGEPPTVTGITTQSTPWGIIVSWSFPTGPNIVERTEIRYSTTSSFADAIQLGGYSYPTNTVTQNSLKIGAEHFYWARLIDKNGEASQWYPATDQPGVRGTASSDAPEYNELITQGILESALGEAMWSNIESIPEMQAQIDALQGAEEWDPDETYLAGTVVFSDGSMYRAIQDVPAQTPITDTDYWQHIGDYDSIMGAIAALSLQMQENTQQIEEIDGIVTATATATSTMMSAMRDNDDGEGQLADVLNEWDSRAWISELRRTMVTESRVEAIVQQQVGAELGDVVAQVEDISQAVVDINGKASAMRTIKVGIDVNDTQYLAGIGVGIENDAGVVQSQVVVVADLFSVMHAVNGTPQSVFSVQNGVAILNEAIIGDATIGTLKLAEWIRSTAMVGSQPVMEWNTRTGQQITRALDGDYRIVRNGKGTYIQYIPTGVWVVELGVFGGYA
ncbi:host specificity protein J [Paracandidimonas soli]|uniref:host specificity protein J n=1 Tax=Paracandidimonas soli TaxID=1917182 RepID=UPI00361C8B99